MKVRWQVEDGYAGKARPHTTEVPDEVLADCESIEEKEMVINDYVEADFEQRISFVITDDGLNEEREAEDAQR